MKRIISFLFAIALTATSLAAPKTLEGVFLGVQMGDYAHLQVKDDAGKEHSFFVGNDKSFMPFVDKPETFKNKRVRVKWQHIKKQIPEAGGAMEIDEAISIEVVKAHK